MIALRHTFTPLMLALVFLAGLGVVAVFWMSLLALSLTLPSA